MMDKEDRNMCGVLPLQYRDMSCPYATLDDGTFYDDGEENDE